MFENKLQVTKECKLIADKAMLVQRWTAWRCGGILCSVSLQLKPNDELLYMFYSTAP